jgi:hypothetical protein
MRFGKAVNQIKLLNKGTTAMQDNSVIDTFIDSDKETMSEIRLKQQVGAAITMAPMKRTPEHLEHLNQYFIRYKFFSNLKRDNKIDTYTQVLKFLKLIKLETNENIIEQGEDGDRFYFVVKG